jgi:anaerobic ribonucleoside-triphosphate reductase activating protein
MTTIRISHTIEGALTDGPGKRFSIYVTGCSIRCKGCQSPELWELDGGRKTDVEDLAAEALASGLPVSVLGGEPFDQAEALSMLIFLLKINGCHVTVYSGYKFEQVARKWHKEWFDGWLMLATLDVLVDGPYVEAQTDDHVQYRGSRNQRVIDMPATLRPYKQLHPLIDDLPEEIELVLLDWDTPELIISPEGHVLAAEGLADEFTSLGESAPARRCGEVQR